MQMKKLATTTSTLPSDASFSAAQVVSLKPGSGANIARGANFDKEGGLKELTERLHNENKATLSCQNCMDGTLFTLSSALGRRRFQCKNRKHSYFSGPYMALYFPKELAEFTASLKQLDSLPASSFGSVATDSEGNGDRNEDGNEIVDDDPFTQEAWTLVSRGTKRVRSQSKSPSRVINLADSPSQEMLEQEVMVLRAKVAHLESQLARLTTQPANINAACSQLANTNAACSAATPKAAFSPGAMSLQSFVFGSLDSPVRTGKKYNVSTTINAEHTPHQVAGKGRRRPLYSEMVKRFNLSPEQVIAMKEARKALKPIYPSKSKPKSLDVQGTLTRIYVHGLKRMALGQVRKHMKSMFFDMTSIRNVSFVSRTVVEFLIVPSREKEFKEHCRLMNMTVLPVFDPSVPSDSSADVVLQTKIQEAFLKRLRQNMETSRIPAVKAYFALWLEGREGQRNASANGMTLEEFMPRSFPSAVMDCDNTKVVAAGEPMVVETVGAVVTLLSPLNPDDREL